MNKPQAMMAKKSFLKWNMEETLRGSRLNKQPILMWVAPDCQEFLFNNFILYNQKVLHMLTGTWVSASA